jgi:hypothetical protein
MISGESSMAGRKSSRAKAIFSSPAVVSGSARNKPGCRRQLLLEALEDRCVPSTIMPTTFADGGAGSGSLRDAVLQFNADTGSADDTIQLQAGTYALTIQNVGGHHETAGLTGDLNLTQTSHRWIIQGAGSSGANATIIDASQLMDRVFQIVNPGTQVVFQDLVIQGGLARDDGSNGAPAGFNALGGGILNNGGAVTLDHVVLQNNVARGGDAAVLTAPGHNASGGGIYSTGGALTIAGAMIANNQAIGGRGGDNVGHILPGGDGGSAEGGGLYATGGSLDISDSMIASNRATGGRGGDNPSSFSAAPLGVGGGGVGGGLYVNGGLLTIANCTIASNQGTGGAGGANGYDGNSEGGGLYNGGTLTVSSSTLTGNSTNGIFAGGGGIFNDYLGTLTVTGSTLSGNTAIRGWGGGIDNGGTLTVTGSTLSGNSANGLNAFGGGIYNDYGRLTVSNSTLSGNSATGYFYGSGGGIYNLGNTLTVSNSTLSDNSAQYWGGGILNYRSNTATLNNSTVSGNNAPLGGGIANITDANFNATVLLRNSTVANNSGRQLYSERVGPISTGQAAMQLRNTIVSGPGLGPNLFAATGGTFVSQGHNLSSDSGSGFLTGSGDLTNTDPLLGPLQDNGGPTKTIALLAGSPALNAGDPDQLGTKDQRGVVRSGGVNIGAYQASASALVVTSPAAVTAGTPFDVTVRAVDVFGQTAIGYTGTVTFTSSDDQAVLPADSTLTNGTGTFSGVTLDTVGAGSQTITATDTADSSIRAFATVTVNPAAACYLVLSYSSNPVKHQAWSLTITTYDAYGNVATGYTSTVRFFSSDDKATRPADYTFTATDGGTHTFSVTFHRLGQQSLTVSDTQDASIFGTIAMLVQNPGQDDQGQDGQ